MNKEEFIDLISFCILMENDGGILEKAPDYVLERWKYKNSGFLDENNIDKLYEYKSRWVRSIEGLDD